MLKKISGLLILVFVVSLFVPFYSEAKTKSYKKAKVILLKGDVLYKKSADKKWKKLKMNTYISKKYEVKVPKDSFVKLMFKDKSILVIKGDTSFVFNDLVKKMVLKRKKSKFLKKFGKKEEKTVLEPTAVAGVRGNKVGDVLKKEKIYWEK